MFSLSWLRERGITRARPSTGRPRTGRAIALSCLAAVALAQTGCRSGGGLFSPCGFVGRTTSRIMQPFRHGSSAGACCGTEIGSDVPIEYASPVGIVSPAVPIGGQVIQGSPAPSPVDTPERLEALPRSEPGPSPSRGGRAPTDSSVRKPPVSYDAPRPANGRVRGDNLAHSLVSSPEAAARPSPETIRTSSNTRAAADDADSVLDHLPPLDLPAEVIGRGDSPPVAPAAVKPQAAASAPAVSSANDHPHGRSAREPEAAPAASEPAPASASAPTAAPATVEGDAIGIARFASVDLKLAGGSAPSTVGLGWLVEKGYKTVLDLRDSSQTSAAFIGEAASRGLRYIALPASLDKLTREQLDRFAFELSINDARPLYFFDEDGRRAGGLWYLRRVLNENASADVARREAEELGLTDSASWKLVYELVDRRLAPKPSDEPPAPTAAPRQAEAPRAAVVSSSPEPAAAVEAAVARTAREPRGFARAALASDSVAWQPFAAMVLTGLTFPLAYFSRTVIPTMIARTRASLPGPERRSIALPPASGA